MITSLDISFVRYTTTIVRYANRKGYTVRWFLYNEIKIFFLRFKRKTLNTLRDQDVLIVFEFEKDETINPHVLFRVFQAFKETF